jgi:hypothetical protein
MVIRMSINCECEIPKGAAIDISNDNLINYVRNEITTDFKNWYDLIVTDINLEIEI